MLHLVQAPRLPGLSFVLSLLAVTLLVGCATDEAPLNLSESADAGTTSPRNTPPGRAETNQRDAGLATTDIEAGQDAETPRSAPQPVASLDVPVPHSSSRSTVDVTFTVSGKSGEDATLYISACETSAAGDCLEVSPLRAADTAGNTWITAVNDSGKETLLEATCHAPAASEPGLPLDLLFVIDTGAKAQSPIAGVFNTLDVLLDDLTARNVVVRVGGIAFGDQAPLQSCAAPDAAYHGFTKKFGVDSVEDESSFNFWLSNLSGGHCFDLGGDPPQNALDALEFALGNDPAASKRSASVFEWDPAALHTIVLVSNAPQHTLTDGAGIAHFSLETVSRDLQGFAVTHVISPNYACAGTLAANCACNLTPGSCDNGCDCDLLCPAVSCPADVKLGACDAGSVCDPDCPGYASGSSCDVRVNVCDSAADPDEICSDDVDCNGGVAVGSKHTRRCDPVALAPYADGADLAAATHGSFVPMSEDGAVDLSTLPLKRRLPATARCEVTLPEDTVAVHCVYADPRDRHGEMSVTLP